jgi:hypothetical protein
MANIFGAGKPSFSQLREGAKKATTWWNDAINKLKVGHVFDTYTDRRKKRLDPRRSVGKLFFFIYDAKTKEQLPWWDQFPLIFLLNTNDNRTHGPSFMGLNFHYLNYNQRIELLSALMKIQSSDKVRDDKKTIIAYDVVLRYSKLAKPCIKTYLFSNVRSEFIEVPKDEWELAMLLGTAKFPREKFVHTRAGGQNVKVPRGDVFDDSAKQAAGGKKTTRKQASTKYS